MLTARMKAAQQGESSYEGAPCKTCGNTKRYTINASCVECANERSKINVKKQRERIKELMAQAREGV